MGKHKKKQQARLEARRQRWREMTSKMTEQAKLGYKMPGSMNRHKGS